MTTKLTQNQISELKENIENESCSTILVDPKLVFEPYSYTQTNPLGPQIDPKIKSNSNVRIQGIIETESR